MKLSPVIYKYAAVQQPGVNWGDYAKNNLKDLKQNTVSWWNKPTWDSFSNIYRKSPILATGITGATALAAGRMLDAVTGDRESKGGSILPWVVGLGGLAFGAYHAMPTLKRWYGLYQTGQSSKYFSNLLGENGNNYKALLNAYSSPEFKTNLNNIAGDITQEDRVTFAPWIPKDKLALYDGNKNLISYAQKNYDKLQKYAPALANSLKEDGSLNMSLNSLPKDFDYEGFTGLVKDQEFQKAIKGSFIEKGINNFLKEKTAPLRNLFGAARKAFGGGKVGEQGKPPVANNPKPTNTAPTNTAPEKPSTVNNNQQI